MLLFGCREEALSAFTLGMLSLEERAEVDIHFDAICDRIMDVGRVHGVTLPEELQPSTRPHSAMYHINLSGMHFSGSCHKSL